LQKTCAAMDLGKECGAEMFVLWGGREGTETDACRNPADAVKPPKVERQKMKALDPAETARLLDHFRGTRMFIPVLLGALCCQRIVDHV